MSGRDVQCSGHWAILGEASSFRAAASTAIHSKLKLRRRQLVFRSRTQTGTLLQSALSPAWRGRSLLVIGCRREVSKKPHRTTPRLPPGRSRTPSANFCTLAGIDFFGACHRAVKRPPVLPVRRGGGQGQPRCDISARRDAAAAALARIRRRAANKPNFSGKRLLPARGQAGQPSNQISRS